MNQSPFYECQTEFPPIKNKMPSTTTITLMKTETVRDRYAQKQFISKCINHENVNSSDHAIYRHHLKEQTEIRRKTIVN